MTTTPETTPADRAEQAGFAIARSLADALYAAHNQAEAHRAFTEALNAAFNDEDDNLINAVAGGFSAGIVNILERGIQAINNDPGWTGEKT